MRAVIQRVSSARVHVAERAVGQISAGLLVFAAVERGDEARDIEYIVRKIKDLRIFEDEAGKMNGSITDTGGSLLVVSQFTLCGDCRKGRRPSFDSAEAPAVARPLYESLVTALRASDLTVETGEFQAHMRVELVNDGPVTVMLDSRQRW
jgi:D-tyrosyl-tRNA(Tyr) deacylase